MTSPLVALTGVTGHVGRRVAHRLAAAGVPLRLVARDPAKAPPIPGADIAAAAYDDGDAMRRALTGAGAVLFVSGREAADRLEHHRRVVEAAANAGVERVVYTSFVGAAPDATFTFARDHFHTENMIRDAGLGFTFLRDSLYLDYVPFLAGADGVIRGPAGDGVLAPVSRDDVADVAAAVLLDPAGHTGRTYQLTGPALISLADAAAGLSRVTGREVSYLAETLEDAYASRASLGAPDWEVAGWVSSYAAIASGELAVVTDDVERVAGHPPVGLPEFLGAHPESCQHLAPASRDEMGHVSIEPSDGRRSPRSAR
ncbi:MAG: NAD(P)-dependent oxidoreductase [Pseudonocardiales bacterium]|nr:MAG: NAD(P)-dependent oxidoreductase [Pseudonocardiales bacterium]